VGNIACTQRATPQGAGKQRAALCIQPGEHDWLGRAWKVEVAASSRCTQVISAPAWPASVARCIMSAAGDKAGLYVR
jgi:hypothetical protein